jgi:hypothetical protein
MSTKEIRLGVSYTEWEILQDDLCVVASNTREELSHYIPQYLEDGDLEIWEVKRTLVQTFTKARKAQEK